MCVKLRQDAVYTGDISCLKRVFCVSKFIKNAEK